jgi:hypothetical protein
MQKLSFFKQFKSWKTFSNWKSLMRRTMYTKTTNFLRKDLFILDAELSKPLLDLRMKTFMARKVPLITLLSPNPLGLEEFA